MTPSGLGIRGDVLSCPGQALLTHHEVPIQAGGVAKGKSRLDQGPAPMAVARSKYRATIDAPPSSVRIRSQGRRGICATAVTSQWYASVSDTPADVQPLGWASSASRDRDAPACRSNAVRNLPSFGPVVPTNPGASSPARRIRPSPVGQPVRRKSFYPWAWSASRDCSGSHLREFGGWRGAVRVQPTTMCQAEDFEPGGRRFESVRARQSTDLRFDCGAS